jgi:hypothetical protein
MESRSNVNAQPRNSKVEDFLGFSGWAILLLFGLVLAPSAQAAGFALPDDLLPGDKYRVAFVTSTRTDASSSDIAAYNAFVTARANSQADLVSLCTTWTAIGSTGSVDARDNTNTNPAGGTGVPIYRIDGIQIANNNTDLWDGGLAWPLNVTEIYTIDPFIYVWTGTQFDGTKKPQTGFGSQFVSFGRSNVWNYFGTTSWLYYGADDGGIVKLQIQPDILSS